MITFLLRCTRRCWLAAVPFALAVLLPAHARAQTFIEPGFTAQTVVTLPAFQVVGMTWADDGAMFIWQKNGIVRIYRNGALLPTPFIDISARVNTWIDRGLLGLALDPDFAANGYVYLAYVHEAGGDPEDTRPKISRVTRVTANPANHDVALPGSEVIVLDDLPVDQAGHSAGTLRFAPDGTLVLSNGDGGSAAVAASEALGALDIDSVRGKILRFNPDGTAPAPPQITNPFYDGTDSVRSKVVALGLRNPFRYDFHPITGEIYACDVGWNEYEELDRILPGGNYGWPCYEGPVEMANYQNLYPEVCGLLEPNDLVAPLYTYDHTQGSAIVGGAFYTGGVYPAEFVNNFFFADYEGGWMRRVVLAPDGNIDQNLLFATNVGVPVSTEVGPDGRLYYADFVSGQIRRIVYNGPVAVASATPTSGYAPLQVSFSSVGSSGVSPSYFWDFGDGSTSTAASPTHTYSTGPVQTYTAELTVQSGTQSALASVDVTVGSRPPTPSIQAPANGVGVKPGVIVNFSGTATDPDQALLPSALEWQVLLHHNTHVHAFVGATGYSGSFAAEYHGVGTYSYELILTATDSSGLSASTSIQVPVLPDGTPPTVPANLKAVAASAYAVGLNWLSASDDAAVASYQIERCTGASCSNFVEVASSAGTNFSNTGLLPQTTYRYRVRARDASENASGYSNIASAQTPSAPPPPSGLVAAYGFGEGFGAAVGDISGNGNHGSTSNGPIWTPLGRYGSALIFDGQNDVVVVPDANSLDLTSGMTLEAWVYPTIPMSDWAQILQKEADAYFLSANTSNDHPGVGGTFGGGSCCGILNGPGSLPQDQWSHVAATYNGSTLRLYVNGVQVTSQSRTGNLLTTSLPLRIGGNTYASEFFQGRIDDVRIYNRALLATEIQSDMNTPLPEPAALPSLFAGVAALAWLRSRRAQRSSGCPGSSSGSSQASRQNEQSCCAQKRWISPEV